MDSNEKHDIEGPSSRGVRRAAETARRVGGKLEAEVYSDGRLSEVGDLVQV